MTKGPSSVAFSLPQPRSHAILAVRKALTRQGLGVAAELDVTSRIKQELETGLAPCVVLYVDDPALLLEALVFDRGAALRIPQPVVLAGNGSHTEVLVHSVEALTEGGLPAGVRGPLLNLHARIVKAMESIAEPKGAHLALSP